MAHSTFVVSFSPTLHFAESAQWDSAWPTQVNKKFSESAVEDYKRKPKTKGSVVSPQHDICEELLIAEEADEMAASTLTETQRALTSTTSKDRGLEIRDSRRPDRYTWLQPHRYFSLTTAQTRLTKMYVSPHGLLPVITYLKISQLVFLSDLHLYARRWEALVKDRDNVDIVQIVTWNDYGESHYIGPIKGAQPNSEAWTRGMDHTGKGLYIEWGRVVSG